MNQEKVYKINIYFEKNNDTMQHIHNALKYIKYHSFQVIYKYSSFLYKNISLQLAVIWIVICFDKIFFHNVRWYGNCMLFMTLIVELNCARGIQCSFVLNSYARPQHSADQLLSRANVLIVCVYHIFDC